MSPLSTSATTNPVISVLFDTELSAVRPSGENAGDS